MCSSPSIPLNNTQNTTLTSPSVFFTALTIEILCPLFGIAVYCHSSIILGCFFLFFFADLILFQYPLENLSSVCLVNSNFGMIGKGWNMEQDHHQVARLSGFLSVHLFRFSFFFSFQIFSPHFYFIGLYTAEVSLKITNPAPMLFK